VTTDQVKTVIDEAVDESRDGFGRRVIVASILVVFAGVVVLAYTMLRGFERIDSLQGQADDHARTAQMLAEQVTRLGGTPVVQPPTVAGPTGPAGPAGRDGTNGRDGQNGTTPPCVSEPPQCRGADGEPGTNGQDGQDGADGQDGKDGKDGVDGKPPGGWTWVDGDGRTQSCTRVAGSPDTDPRYACTAPSSGPPGTTTTTFPPLLGGP